MGLTDLLNRLDTDKEFEAKYQELGSLEAMIAQANEDGYSVTEKEVYALIKEQSGGNLSDGDIEGVAGAQWKWPISTWGYMCETPPISDICSFWCKKKK